MVFRSLRDRPPPSSAQERRCHLPRLRRWGIVISGNNSQVLRLRAGVRLRAGKPARSRYRRVMGVSVSYDLTGAGWANCQITTDDDSVGFLASYLSDALYDFLTATTSVVRGADEAAVLFVQEPDCIRLTISRDNNDTVRLLLTQFPDLWPGPLEPGDVVFDQQVRIRTFAGAALSAAQSVLRDEGVEGYREKWKLHPFPLDAMNALKSALGE